MKNKVVLGLIAIAFLAGTIVTSSTVQNAAAAVPTLADLWNAIKDIQTKINSATFGLLAIKTSVDTKSSQTSVNTLQTTADTIKAKTDNLPPDPASQSLIGNTKSVVVEKLLNVPAPSATSDGIAILELIPATSGKTFSGHISLHFTGSSTEVVDVECEMETGAISLGQIGFNDAINTDFACNQIRLFLVNHDTIPNSGTIEAVIQYVENSNISTIT
ncbi:MAG TPA: hypothetical protein VFG24_08545 [Nitrosopumilaceae archaeon]|nr:hypothetical protein [Nitrosopumilaceae archaeon]